ANRLARFRDAVCELCSRSMVSRAQIAEGIRHGVPKSRYLLRERGQSDPTRSGRRLSADFAASPGRIYSAGRNSKPGRGTLQAATVQEEQPPADLSGPLNLEMSTRMSSVELQRYVRWADADAAGRLYFPRIFDYFGEAERELLRQTGLSREEHADG